MPVLLCLLSTVSLVSCMATGSLRLSAFPSAQFPEPWGRYLKTASHIGLSVPLSALSDCGNSLCKGGHAHPGTNTPTELSGHGARGQRMPNLAPAQWNPSEDHHQMPAGSWQGPWKEASVCLPWLPAQNPALNSSNLHSYLYPCGQTQEQKPRMNSWGS